MVSLDDFINTSKDEVILPPNTHKFKHRILIRGDPKDPTKIITGIPVIHNVTNQLVAFVELKREKNKYLP